MTDLQIAKEGLAGHTICLCKDGKLIFSDKRGISPMIDFIESGTDLNGYSVADLVVGKAAAFLFVKCKIKNVFAKTISESGKDVLEKNGIHFEYETLTEKIVNRAGTDICPMEKAVSNTENAEETYELLKKQLELFQS